LRDQVEGEWDLQSNKKQSNQAMGGAYTPFPGKTNQQEIERYESHDEKFPEVGGISWSRRQRQKARVMRVKKPLDRL
jgi:hypothetical protein